MDDHRRRWPEKVLRQKMKRRLEESVLRQKMKRRCGESVESMMRTGLADGEDGGGKDLSAALGKKWEELPCYQNTYYIFF